MSTAFQVEAIIGRRVFSGKVLYLAKWKDYPLEEATWESVKVLRPYRNLIKTYNEKHRQDNSHTSFKDESLKSEDVPAHLVPT